MTICRYSEGKIIAISSACSCALSKFSYMNTAVPTEHNVFVVVKYAKSKLSTLLSKTKSSVEYHKHVQSTIESGATFGLAGASYIMGGGLGAV